MIIHSAVQSTRALIPYAILLINTSPMLDIRAFHKHTLLTIREIIGQWL